MALAMDEWVFWSWIPPLGQAARIDRYPKVTTGLPVGLHIHHQAGSHVNLRHQIKTYLHVVVPRHSRELAPKTLKTILSQAEVSVEEFRKLI